MKKIQNKGIVIILFFLFVLNYNFSSAQTSGITLSSNSKVSLLTCSPGDELYSVFGHSAIRVQDSVNKIDLVFNYGTFDFSDPNFYTNFVKGKLNYILSLARYKNFLNDYAIEERWVYEQELNISLPQRQMMLDTLAINYMPENRYYLYDFFFDNCATRIRDIFVEGIPMRIEFDYSPLGNNKSFRDLLQPYLVQKPWARLGIDLALGLPTDRIATPWEYMFLPDHMLTVFQHASFVTDSFSKPFAAEPVVILEGKRRNEKEAANHPLILCIFILLAAIAVTFFDFRRKKVSTWFDAILFGLVGLLGILVVFLWFFTDHSVTPLNLNILWAHPLHLLVLIAIPFKRLSGFVKNYFMVICAMLALLLLVWYFIPQHLPWTIYPVVIALTIRSGYRGFFNK